MIRKLFYSTMSNFLTSVPGCCTRGCCWSSGSSCSGKGREALSQSFGKGEASKRRKLKTNTHHETPFRSEHKRRDDAANDVVQDTSHDLQTNSKQLRACVDRLPHFSRFNAKQECYRFIYRLFSLS